MFKNKTLFVIVLLVVVAIFVAAGVWIGTRIVRNAQYPSGASPYVAVYMATGDVYFGKLSWFPSPHLTDVWFLQKGTDANGQNQLGVAPFTSAFWGPVDAININMSQVLFWTHLRNDSQIVPALANPAALFGTGAAPSTTTP